MLKKYFDKTYCINLDRRPDRWEQAQSEFKKHNITVERFSAIDGNPNNIQTNIVIGHVGCVLSHLNIIKEAKDKKLKNILIFEDDVVFSDDFNDRFESMYEKVPKDWNMLYFGGSHHGKLEMISDNIGRARKTYTTHAYAIKSDVFDVAIKLLSKAQYEVDVTLSLMQQSFNVYVIRPHLAWQRDGYSDILNKDVNYDFLKEG
jgi:GR25 family glycosyltransferase involved in LPS biosynthesis